MPADWIRYWSIGVRSALAAGLISAVLFTTGALWLRSAVADVDNERIAARAAGANAMMTALKSALSQGKPPIGRFNTPFAVVAADGQVRWASEDVPRMPPPSKYDSPGPELQTLPVTPLFDMPQLSAAIQVLAETVSTSAWGDLRVYAFIPRPDENPIAELDPVLWWAVPAAAALVALVAWAATAFALRPVERIRRQAAEISTNALHRRVEVPFRGWGMRSWSIGLRSAVAAGLIATVPFVAGAVWLRHAVDDINNGRMMANRETSFAADGALQILISHGLPIPQSIQDSPQYLFEAVRVDGRVVASSTVLKESERRAGGSIMPAPRPTMTTSDLDRFWVDDDLKLRLDSLLPIPFSQERQPVGSLVGTGSDLVRIYVFQNKILDWSPAPELDRVLWPGVPIAAVLIGLVAWAATTRALVPVERIRRQAAEIGSQGLHLRVPVPPTRDAIARLAVTLNKTLDRLENSVQVQQQFIADAAHELRSPIASLRTVLEVAAEHPEMADWPAVVSDAVTDTQRLQGLAEDLLLLARLDSARPLRAAHVDLAELARAHLARRQLITVQAPEPAPMLGDPDQLERMLRNLVDNAERHAAENVTVTVRSTLGTVILEVADDGPGIAPQDQERIFDRFTRLDEARDSDAGGAGLGLAIAREIANRHDGTLEVGTQEPGAVFVAVFPRFP